MPVTSLTELRTFLPVVRIKKPPLSDILRVTSHCPLGELNVPGLFMSSWSPGMGLFCKLFAKSEHPSSRRVKTGIRRTRPKFIIASLNCELGYGIHFDSADPRFGLFPYVYPSALS